MQTKGNIPAEAWEHAAKYIRHYARASHWKVTSLKKLKNHIEMTMEYSPPKPRLMIGPIQQKTSE